MINIIGEIKNNSGILSKLMVLTLRFGQYTKARKNNLLILPLYVLYRLFDLLFCKMLLNSDISPDAEIGYGIKIYHPYGIFINENAVIGANFTCRGQITIGNKGTQKNDGAPIIGDNVTIGTGARVIGPIEIGNNCTIGANAVVTKSYPDHSILVGIPAHPLKHSSQR